MRNKNLSEEIRITGVFDVAYARMGSWGTSLYDELRDAILPTIDTIRGYFRR